MFSLWSQQERVQPKLEVNNTKRATFIKALAAVLVLYALVAICITRNITLIAQFSIFNTAISGYALTYWILLKEKIVDHGR